MTETPKRYEQDDPDAPWNRPPGWILFARRHIWKIGAILLVLMVTATRPFLAKRAAPPPVLGEVPEFTLTTESGESFSREDMDGKVWVVGFVFTRCTTSCPVISQAMVSFHEELERSRVTDHVNMLIVTVDPEHDTPELLTKYAADIGADTDSWTLLTGESEAVKGFVVDGFKQAVGDKETTETGAMDIAHSSRMVLVDRFGGIRGYYSIDEESRFELYHRVIATMRAEEGVPRLEDLSPKSLGEFGGAPK